MNGTLRLAGNLLVLTFALALSACSGGGGSTTVTPDIVPVDPTPVPIIPYTPYEGDEGAPQSPVPVSSGAPRPSSVGIGGSYYTFVAPATGSYSIALVDPSADVGWELFTDTTYSSTSRIASCDTAWTAATEKCTANLVAGTTYYLEVNNWDWTPASFALNIKLLGNEGTTASPIPLTLDVPYDGSVATAGTSYYYFTSNVASAYSVAISGASAGALTIKIFASAFDTNPLQSCSSWDRPVCTVNGLSAATPYFVEVIGDSSVAVSYTITVTQGVSQGSATNPVALTVDAASAHAGAVDGTSDSYYTFTTASSGEYLLKLTVPYGVTAYVYKNSDFTTGYIKSCAVSECRLSALDAYTPYYIRVRNVLSSDQTYQIAVNRGLTEGSLAQPVPLVVDVAHSAAINSSGIAYYSFQTTAFAGSYTLTLSNTQSDLMWNLYTSLSAYNSISQCNSLATAGDESCASTNLEPNTTYYLTVTNNSSTATSNYGVLVTAGGGSQGTVSNPIDLGVVAPAGLTYSTGQVKKSGYSYYKFTTGANRAVHVVSLLNMQADLEWELSSNLNYAGFKTCDRYTNTADEICSTQDASKVLVDPTPGMLEGNTTYYLRVRNNGSVTSTFALNLMPLDPAVGCSGTFNECLDFEGGIPAGITQSSNQNGTKWQWTQDTAKSAGPGSSSLVSGIVDYPLKGCFSYTPAVRPNSVTYSFLTQDEYLNLYISEGTTQLAIYFDYTLSNWKRNTYDLPAGTAPLTFMWCLQRNTSTGTPAIWVDDIEFE